MSATGGRCVPWSWGEWRGLAPRAIGTAIEPLLALASTEGGRPSRHARTFAASHDGGRVWVKVYPSAGGRYARRAARMSAALRAAGLSAPETVLVGWSRRTGMLVSADVGGVPLLEAVAGVTGRPKRAVLTRLGAAVARLHDAGFVAGDLVPSNVMVRGEDIVFLDHDRTRRSRVLVWWHGRRNLVQLGRFVVPGLTLTDRARVLAAYASGRGWRPERRRRVARWVAAKIMTRRARIDGIDATVARSAGLRELMRSGGPYDPARRGGHA